VGLLVDFAFAVGIALVTPARAGEALVPDDGQRTHGPLARPSRPALGATTIRRMIQDCA